MKRELLKSNWNPRNIH